MAINRNTLASACQVNFAEKGWRNSTRHLRKITGEMLPAPVGQNRKGDRLFEVGVESGIVRRQHRNGVE